MKGYYITYGVFSNSIDDVVQTLSMGLSINIFKGSQGELDEIYHTENIPENPFNIVHISVLHSSKLGYYLETGETVYPNYLISCNIIIKDKKEDNNISYIDKIREVIKSIGEIEELNIEEDEW